MSADPLEGRERARQEFEKWANSVDYVELFDAWQAGRRSLEQERDELRTALQHAHLYFLQSNKLTVDDREMLDEMWAALHKGDS